MGLPEKKYISAEEYLTAESVSVEKHEYFNGEIYAMECATVEHNLIVANTFGEIYGKLKDKQCKIMTSDLRVNVQSNGLYTYPDISIVCGEIEKSADAFDSITNPIVIIEVLSEGTKDYDRGSKFMLYRGIPSLKSYILIDSTGHVMVEVFSKNQNNIWQLKEYKSIDNIMDIEPLDIGIGLVDIYSGVYG
jgi:Uma2 family endonuclease